MKRLAAALTVALTWPALATGGEGISLLPGDTVTVKSSTISCAIADGVVRCNKAGGLTAILTRDGKVQVNDGTKRVFARHVATARSRHLRLGISGGFDVGGAPIECHVYVGKGRTMSCSTINAAGGLPKSYGFDLSSSSVVVFRYGASADLHVVKTIPQ